MARSNDNKGAGRVRWTTTGYAARDKDLSAGTPASLRAVPAPGGPFDHARDPHISRQIRDMEKSETQRREEGGRGSKMIRLHKPFPELKPKRDLSDSPIRQAFNRAWFQEQRAARFAELDKQRAQRNIQSYEPEVMRRKLRLALNR